MGILYITPVGVLCVELPYNSPEHTDFKPSLRLRFIGKINIFRRSIYEFSRINRMEFTMKPV